MTTSIPVRVVRVFAADDGSLGNELGIVESSPQTEGREQEIALSLGFSETVFVDDEVEGRATIRIFTPASELPFAGHPSVGTAWWLRERGVPATVLVEPAGDVAVRLDGETTWITGRASWAPDFTWHELGAADEVDALDAGAFVDGNHYVYAWFDEPRGRMRSRMFAPDMGIVEDQATGSAAVALTERLGRDLDITQGLGCRLQTRHLGGGLVEVGGRVAADADGEVELS